MNPFQDIGRDFCSIFHLFEGVSIKLGVYVLREAFIEARRLRSLSPSIHKLHGSLVKFADTATLVSGVGIEKVIVDNT